jgi:hypothetical protein
LYIKAIQVFISTLKHYRQIHAPDIQQEPAVKIQICNTTERSLLAGGLGEERFDLRQ